MCIGSILKNPEIICKICKLQQFCQVRSCGEWFCLVSLSSVGLTRLRPGSDVCSSDNGDVPVMASTRLRLPRFAQLWPAPSGCFLVETLDDEDILVVSPWFSNVPPKILSLKSPCHISHIFHILSLNFDF
jgi:hypothetical protein